MENTNNDSGEAPGQNKIFEIIVNGREKEYPEKKISYSQVVECAFPNYPGGENTIFTITYKKGPDKNHEGTMVAGDEVRVHSGMIFNVAATDKS